MNYINVIHREQLLSVPGAKLSHGTSGVARGSGIGRLAGRERN